MYPITFKQAYDKPLGAGDNPNTGDLPFVVARDPNTPGPVMIVSSWRLTEEELAEINATGRVFVAVMAHPKHRTQPPISIHGLDPFEYPDGRTYKVAPRTYQEEQIDEVIAGANAQIKREEIISDAEILEIKVRALVAAGVDPYQARELRSAEVPLIQEIVKKIADEVTINASATSAKVAEGATAFVTIQASGGKQIFPESNGLAPAVEVRQDPRSSDFDIEKTDKDFNVKARTHTEEVTGKALATD